MQTSIPHARLGMCHESVLFERLRQHCGQLDDPLEAVTVVPVLVLALWDLDVPIFPPVGQVQISAI